MAGLVSLERVGRVYDGGRIVAVADVALTVPRGEFLAICGPSGSGKPALLPARR